VPVGRAASAIALIHSTVYTSENEHCSSFVLSLFFEVASEFGKNGSKWWKAQTCCRSATFLDRRLPKAAPGA
jgi:hypothetical protein